MNILQPHLEVLSEAQLALWKELSEVPNDFVLYGGTALALRLGHRKSVFNPILSLKALCYFGDGDLAMLPEDVRSELKSAVSAVDPLNLPVVKALPGGHISRGDQ